MTEKSIIDGGFHVNDETPISNLTVAQLRQVLKPNKKEYLTIRAMAERFNVSTVTVYNWIKTGKVHPVKIGGRTYFDEQQIIEELNQGFIGKYKHKV
ncbi:helix-turn-helix domain-containing protein [Prevotella sp. 10(H)]|uniref:helix-turn-helix domain-containing protein n=1 Tax=Prevotella sp. 10(H) TaxID=1158294 RepID=UPI000565691C|nr:helix-turn-helix domain-containing protein [Prevotella sp. 10(H)]